MCKGPEADEFNIGGVQNFGNWITKLEFKLYNIYFFLQDGVFQYYVFYFGISFLGFYTHELYYSFQLLDVIQRFPALNDVLKAVTSNAEQLLMTGMLGMIIVYIHTTISFFYLQDTLYDYSINANDSDWIGENQCQTMLMCFLSLIYSFVYGGGIADYTEPVSYKDNF